MNNSFLPYLIFKRRKKNNSEISTPLRKKFDYSTILATPNCANHPKETNPIKFH